MALFMPLFPLQIVVFPNENLNLHIFEPRYKELINECEEVGSTFGIPAYLDGKVQSVGTEIRVLKVAKRHKNGEMDIKTKGVGLFRISQFHRSVPGKLYSGADIERIEFDMKGEPALYESILDLMTELFKILNIQKELPEEGFDTYSVAHHIGLTVEQEYELLCIPSEYDRQVYIRTTPMRLIPIVAEMERLREKVQMNGHFKNIIPPKL